MILKMVVWRVVRRLMPAIGFLACGPAEEDAGAADASALEAISVFVPEDSVSLTHGGDDLLRVVALAADSFAVAGYPDDPLCFVALRTHESKCVPVKGGGPAEVLGIEEFSVWPPASVAIWDGQTGKLGVWSRSGRPDTTIQVMRPSLKRQILIGVLPDSTVIVGESAAFDDMPIGVHPIVHKLFAVRGGTTQPVALSDGRESWTSVVEGKGYRSGRNVPSFDESFDVVTRGGVLRVDARRCVLEAPQSEARPIPADVCGTGANGFREAVLRSLDSADGPDADTHRAKARASDIPESYPSIAAVLASYHTDEVALRRGRTSKDVAPFWAVLRRDGSVVERLTVPGGIRLLGFSRTHFVGARAPVDSEESVQLLFMPRASR
ncbi:MAG: hypothetical protein IBJ03_06800 [Gemmatimonadaceae bacterium]|nr:hypothetical protein [Gemmatimonadaceae bacterium]